MKMKTYFISDLHLGHANCIRFDKRPGETVEEMDMEIIRRWNRKVRNTLGSGAIKYILNNTYKLT